jgi:membrane protein YqaA with SNARE-associated domain
MKIWFRKFHIYIIKIAATKWGMLTLFLCSFADASILPIPVTTLFMTLLILNPHKIIKLVFFVVTGTLAGGLAGYFIGHFAWLKPNGEYTGMVQFLMDHIPGFTQEVYEKVHRLFTRWDFWILSAAAAIPLPYAMFTLTSGIFGVNIFIFLIATLISQGVKFILLALFTLRIRPHFRRLTQLNWKPLAIITSISIVVAIVVLRVM